MDAQVLPYRARSHEPEAGDGVWTACGTRRCGFEVEQKRPRPALGTNELVVIAVSLLFPRTESTSVGSHGDGGLCGSGTGARYLAHALAETSD